jgi:DNA-binding Xre family transcriptional regulator
MSLNDLLNSIANLPERSREVPSSPPLETVAFFVRWSRGLKNWKVSTLAYYAGVSVSTVERVERGEKVSVENLDRIALALGYDRGQLRAYRLVQTRWPKI